MGDAPPIQVLLEGWLMKRGTSFGRSWRKHWFHLHRELNDESNIVLAFQKKIGEVATGELELTTESCVTAGEPGQPHSFNLTLNL